MHIIVTPEGPDENVAGLLRAKRFYTNWLKLAKVSTLGNHPVSRIYS